MTEPLPLCIQAHFPQRPTGLPIVILPWTKKSMEKQRTCLFQTFIYNTLTMSNLCFFANTLCIFCFYFEPHISNTLIFLLMFSCLFTVHGSLVSYSVKLFQTNSTYLYSFQGMFSFFCKWITLTVLNIYLPLELYVHMYRITFGALLI